MTITDEMVEKAARAFRVKQSNTEQGVGLPYGTSLQDACVSAALSAVAPLIRSAALEEAALPTRRQDMTDLELVELALRRVADREERRWATHGTVHTAKVELLREIAARPTNQGSRALISTLTRIGKP